MNLLQGSFSLDQPDIHIPLIGNRWLVGGFFLAHIIFGSFTMGALVLTPTFEWVGVVRRDPRYERLARALGSVILRIFSLGATLGSFAVIVLTAMFPKFFISLIILFFWPALIAFTIWFFTLFGLLIYNLRWDRFVERKGAHIAIGYLTAATEHIFLVIIVALSSFQLTPGAGQGAGAFFNPSYWPELGHRFVGNLSWAAFFIAAVAAVYAAATRLPEDRRYFHWVAGVTLVVGLVTLVPQVLFGFVFVESIKAASPGAYRYSLQGPFSWLWLVQATFLAILLVGSNLYFWQSRPGQRGAPLLTGIVTGAALITILPAPLFPKGWFWLRYVALGLALLASVVHWLFWRRLSIPSYDLRRSGQVVLAVTGLTAMLLFLLMGVIRTTARSDFTVYGKLKESDSFGLFEAPSNRFYP